MAALLRFDPPADDALGVLTSTAPVAHGATHVRIVPEAVQRFALATLPRFAAAQDAPGAAATPRTPQDALHCYFLPPRRRLNYLLVVEALNFSFWDAAPRWIVPWQGARYNGYWALAAALRRAVVEDAAPVWDAAWMATLRAPALARLLRGEGRPPPLLEARLAHLREAGAVLQARWDGQFAQLVAAADGDATALVRLIVAELPSFRDESTWRGADGAVHTVRFYKRAQICAADLARLLAGHPLGGLRGMERLTAFADYKVPQVLRAQGVLELAPALAARVDAGEELPAGGAEEVELRAATVWACEWIARACNRNRMPGQAPVTAADVDALLWDAGQDAPGQPPYHRTRTVYY